MVFFPGETYGDTDRPPVAEIQWQIQRMVHRAKEAVDQTLRVVAVLLPEVDAWRAQKTRKGAMVVVVGCTKNSVEEQKVGDSP